MKKNYFKRFFTLLLTVSVLLSAFVPFAMAESNVKRKEKYYDIFPYVGGMMKGSSFPIPKQFTKRVSYDAASDSIKSVSNDYISDARSHYTLSKALPKSYKFAKLLYKYEGMNTVKLGWAMHVNYAQSGWQLYPTNTEMQNTSGGWKEKILNLTTFNEEISEFQHIFVWNSRFPITEGGVSGHTSVTNYTKYIAFFENKEDAENYDLSIKRLSINGIYGEIDNVAHTITFNMRGKTESIFKNAQPILECDPLATIDQLGSVNYTDGFSYAVTNVLGKELVYDVIFDYGYSKKQSSDSYIISFESPEEITASCAKLQNYDLDWGSTSFDSEEKALYLDAPYGAKNHILINKTIPNLSEYKYARVKYKYIHAGGVNSIFSNGIGFSGHSGAYAELKKDFWYTRERVQWYSDIADISAHTANNPGKLRFFLGNATGNGNTYKMKVKYIALFKTYEAAQRMEDDFEYVTVTQNGSNVTAKMNYTGFTENPRLLLALYQNGKLVDLRKTDTIFEDTMSISINTLNYPDGEYTAKAFVWKNDSQKPYYECVSEKIIAVSNIEYDLQNEKKEEWKQVAFVSARLKALGVEGGEGAQAILYVTTDSTGEVVMSFSDAGTIFISSDGGETWERGGRNVNDESLATGEIDPNNPDRVVGYTFKGAPDEELNSNFGGDGIYLSENRGFSFEQTMKYCELNRGWRTAFAWDSTSYDDSIKGSRICYFTTNHAEMGEGSYEKALKMQMTKGYNDGPGLYRSLDGGYTWQLSNANLGGATPAVSYADGKVFAACKTGLYASTDHGKTWSKVISGNVNSVHTINSKPNNVYISDELGVLVSTDNGVTFTRVANSTFPSYTKDGKLCEGATFNLKVSNADPDYMMVSYDPYQFGGHVMNLSSYYSHDGGKTWTRSGYNDEYDFYHHQPRWKVTAWDPRNKNKVWSNSDWVEVSWDGGKTFQWNQNGNSGTCINSPFIFNVYNPDRYLVPAQDYRGAYTLDGGETFTSILSKDHGYDIAAILSHNYGGYIVDENTYFFCTTKTWENSVSNLVITHDGGLSYQNMGEVTSGARHNYCLQSQIEPNVYFAGNLRSSDGGYTWSPMPSHIRCVAAYNPYGNELFAIAKDGKSVYKSTDTGITWTKLFDAPIVYKSSLSGINTIAYDGVNDIIYFTQADVISKYENGIITRLNCSIMKDKWRTSIAVDPRYPNIIYTGGVPNGKWGEFKTYDMTTSIFRSCDGGKTWQTISSADTEETIVKTGPMVGNYYTWTLIVHPETGEVYAGMPNYGLYKFAPPYETEK